MRVLKNLRAVCADCSDTGYVPTPQGAKPCACRTERMTGEILAAAMIPERYRDAGFDSYIPQKGAGFASQGLALGRLKQYAEGWPQKSGLLLMGPCGVGKTHLAIATMKALIKARQARAFFYDSRDLLKLIQSTYDKESKSSEVAILEPIETVDLLVLDEFGASKPTEWVVETITRIINKRYNECRPTIFTTNYLDDPPAGEESLEQRIGVRLRSRLFEMADVVAVAGQDFRRIKK